MDFNPSILLQTTLWGYVAGAIVALLCARRGPLAATVSFAVASVAALCGCWSSILYLTAGGPAFKALWLPPLIPYVQFSVQLDPLSAFFLLVVSILALATSIFSIGYARGQANAGVLGVFYNGLLLATTLVPVAANAFFFLIAWEIMALTAFCLIAFEHEKDEARNAGVLFFVMSHIGTGCLILGFLLLFQAAGGYDFGSFHALGNAIPAAKRNAIFLLFLVGFGVKAGIVPLHIWLPSAHPVAPSNVSAFMSGALIKTGIYGMARVFFDFLGTPPDWWGVTVLTIGAVSAVLGVLYALMEHDLKRLLAYHSIENIGIILMGFGASLMFLHSGHPVLASLALAAGLYHTINHAIFKALLFLGAGAVVRSAGSRNMEELGGLAKRMRWTSLFFLIGAVAISALPPLNGFVSEWLTYQSLLQGFGTTTHLIRIMFPMSAAMLALTGALAAACFVKAFGITFLAQPRSAQAAGAKEAPAAMLIGQALLTLACIVLGFYPLLALKWLDPVTEGLTGLAISPHLAAANGLVLSNSSVNGGTISMAGLAIVGVALAAAPLVLRVVFGLRAKTRRAPTWDCGLRGLTPRMEYTATGFSKPIRMIFKALFRPRRQVQREYDFSPFFTTTLRFESHVEEVFLTRLYRPFNRLVQRTSRRLRAVQAGSLQAYLIYIFVTLVLLLLFAL